MKEELDSICKECKKENKKIKVYDLGVALSLFILASVWRNACHLTCHVFYKSGVKRKCYVQKNK